jgi:glucuronate isomerase
VSRIAFELVSGAELAALDLVQAARIFPNVYPGGLWWFNFRVSTYRANMQFRVEALPAPRAFLVASDARCVEWLYGKVLYVKRALTDFLWDQIQRGFLDRETTLYVARQWLYYGPRALYAARGEM